MEKLKRKTLIIAMLILSIIAGIMVFIFSKSVIISIGAAIMISIILWQYYELQKDKKTLEILKIREKELDKEIEDNLSQIERFNSIFSQHNRND